VQIGRKSIRVRAAIFSNDFADAVVSWWFLDDPDLQNLPAVHSLRAYVAERHYPR